MTTSDDDNFIDEAKRWATMLTPGAGTSGEEFKAFDRMSMIALAGVWSGLQYVELRFSNKETYDAAIYFDHLPHEHPERAFELVLTVLRSEADKSVKMQLNDKLMGTLLYKHSAKLVDEIEAAARDNAQLRWLLGGCAWWAGDENAKARLQLLADEDGWNADAEARSTPAEAIDFPSLSATELARVWIEQKSKPSKDQDDNWSALMDFERDLLTDNPDAMLDMVIEVLRLDPERPILGLLAAGPLEDVISHLTINRIERIAAGNPKFAWLLGGVWYWNEPEDIKKRLDAIVQGQRWDN